MFYLIMLIFLTVCIVCIHRLWLYDRDIDEFSQFQKDFIKKRPTAKRIRERDTDTYPIIFFVVIFSSLFMWIALKGFSEIGQYGNMQGGDKSDPPALNALFCFVLLCLSSAGIIYTIYLVYAAIMKPRYYKLIYTKDELLIYENFEFKIIEWDEVRSIAKEPDSDSVSLRLKNRTIDVSAGSHLPQILEILESRGVRTQHITRKP